MNADKLMINALSEFETVREEQVLFFTWNVRNLTFLKVRDILYANGRILNEDIDNRIYVARIKCGPLYSGFGIVAIKTDDGTMTLAVYAREGLIKTHRGERISNELKDKFKKYIV